MPTRRMIEPAIWQSESMGRLTIRQRLMFIGMFSNADDQGRLRASAPVIRSMIFPFDDIQIQDIETDILKIESEGCVMLYGSNGSRFAQVINWWAYQQHQWAYPSKIPKPDGWSDRLRYRQNNDVITDNWIRDSNRDRDRDRIDTPKDESKGLPKSLGKDNPKDSAAKPRPSSPLPIQAQVFIDAGGKFTTGKLADGTTKKDNAIRVICETVKTDDASLLLWRQVVSAYVVQWSPKSWTVMLNEYYCNGRIPGQSRNGNGNGHKPESTGSPMMDAILKAQQEPGYGK